MIKVKSLVLLTLHHLRHSKGSLRCRNEPTPTTNKTPMPTGHSTSATPNPAKLPDVRIYSDGSGAHSDAFGAGAAVIISERFKLNERALWAGTGFNTYRAEVGGVLAGLRQLHDSLGGDATVLPSSNLHSPHTARGATLTPSRKLAPNGTLADKLSIPPVVAYLQPRRSARRSVRAYPRHPFDRRRRFRVTLGVCGDGHETLTPGERLARRDGILGRRDLGRFFHLAQ
jgi:hypothetical protein